MLLKVDTKPQTVFEKHFPRCQKSGPLFLTSFYRKNVIYLNCPLQCPNLICGVKGWYCPVCSMTPDWVGSPMWHIQGRGSICSSYGKHSTKVATGKIMNRLNIMGRHAYFPGRASFDLKIRSGRYKSRPERTVLNVINSLSKKCKVTVPVSTMRTILKSEALVLLYMLVVSVWQWCDTSAAAMAHEHSLLLVCFILIDVLAWHGPRPDYHCFCRFWLVMFCTCSVWAECF